MLARVVADHEYKDIRSLRHRSLASYEARQEINGLAAGLIERMDGLQRQDKPTEIHGLLPFDKFLQFCATRVTLEIARCNDRDQVNCSVFGGLDFGAPFLSPSNAFNVLENLDTYS